MHQIAPPAQKLMKNNCKEAFYKENSVKIYIISFPWLSNIYNCLLDQPFTTVLESDT